MQQSRLRIVQAIFTNGFAGSERITVELCNSLAEHHDVLLLVSSDADEHVGHSILEHVSEKVRVQKIPRGFRHLRVALAVWRSGVSRPMSIMRIWAARSTMRGFCPPASVASPHGIWAVPSRPGGSTALC